MGYNYAKENFSDGLHIKLVGPVTGGERRIFLCGDEAVGLGAISAGCKFYAAYPMTPPRVCSTSWHGTKGDSKCLSCAPRGRSRR